MEAVKLGEVVDLYNGRKTAVAVNVNNAFDLFQMNRIPRRFTIGLALYGCANRPFFPIAVMKRRAIPQRPWSDRVIEQIGSYDPLPNKHNEKMVAINYERLRYWISKNAKPSRTVAELLGKKRGSFHHLTVDIVHS